MGIEQISAADETSPRAGFPELTELGRRLEMLRIARSLSKQHLARHAGISRQQLWRVMTGKSELTPSLGTRLAEVLGVDPVELSSGLAQPVDFRALRSAARAANNLEVYLADPNAIARTIATLPGGDVGRSVKREFLNILEDQAIARGHTLSSAFFDVRRQILSGEL